LSWRDSVQNLGQILSSRSRLSWSWTKFGSIRTNLSNSFVSALWTQIWIHIHYLDPKWMWIRFSIELTP